MVAVGGLMLVFAFLSSTRRNEEGKRRKESGGLATSDEATGNTPGNSKEDPSEILAEVI